MTEARGNNSCSLVVPVSGIFSLENKGEEPVETRVLVDGTSVAVGDEPDLEEEGAERRRKRVSFNHV